MLSFKKLFNERQNDVDKSEQAESAWADILEQIKQNSGILEPTVFDDGINAYTFSLSYINDEYEGVVYFMFDPMSEHMGYYDDTNNAIYINADEDAYDKYMKYFEFGTEEFDETAEKFFTKLFDENIFIHEFIHYLDHNNYQVFDKTTYSDHDHEDPTAYFNNQSEINARFLETLAKYKYKIDNFDRFPQYLNAFFTEWNDVHGDYKHITKENRKRIAKRLHDYWDQNK
tara:strand:- start:39251 stop:39937 length:687 start_codon:yes stop_codon:yes gene_type:complete